MEDIPQKPDLGQGKDFIIDQARASRQLRAANQKNEAAALVIQRTVRKYTERRKFRSSCRQQLDDLMGDFDPEKKENAAAIDVFMASYFIVKRFEKKTDVSFLEKLCRYVVWSLSQECAQISYIGIGLKKTLSLYWISHLREMISACVESIGTLKPELLADSKQLSIFLSTIVTLTSAKGWKLISVKSYESLRAGMEKLSINLAVHLYDKTTFYESLHSVLQAALSRPGRVAVKKANLQAMATLANRPNVEEFPSKEKTIGGYMRNMLTVPAYVYHVNNMCPEAVEEKLFPKLMDYAYDDKNLKDILDGKDLSLILALLANLVQLGERFSKDGDLNQYFYPKFAMVISTLLKECNELKEQPKSKTHWHPIFGWVAQPIPAAFLNSVEQFRTQIEYLWSPNYIEAAFSQLFEFSATNRLLSSTEEKAAKRPMKGVILLQKSPPTTVKSTIFKAVRRVFSLDSSHETSSPHVLPSSSSVCSSYQPYLKFSNEISIKVAAACELYTGVIKTLPICKIDILTGLCFKNSSKTLVALWKFVQLLDRDKTNNWMDVILAKPSQVQEEIIILFADAMIHFTTILDDQEMYEDQKVLSLEEFAELAQFVNRLCYRLISHQNHTRIKEKVWKALKTLLIVLYRRDCRRKYCADDAWLIETNKMNQLISDIEKGRKNAKRILLDMPHVLREEARVILFRKWATSEKLLNGNSLGEHETTSTANSTLITIQRGRIVEDGYAQLATLSPKALKGTIRVRFQNALGLDEAGIDQDGVFKEFLEETINSVFNPTLNLFKATSENLLYPSPLSYLHENYLQLFEFVGKMLAKAIYEGIVVDVHFAPFFLSQILGHQQNAVFSAIDELQSLDIELYKSLNYIKHYDGNVQDLELTFSVDQDVLGEIKTTELIPGGSTLPVTNDNKISYLYLMAHFHLSMQIKEQTAAFLKGFRSIIPFEWIRIFSPNELQRLISGEDTDIDLQDLRRNTQYYGGFHDNHRVVCWLWEILEHDFYEQERRQFLKFVTSCSKPPLLGFANMDPPFSIRCVEVSDDEDTGDTIGSVLRGFLTIGKKDPVGRLPTSSTCFNLLKLPNYHKKSTLREKLRYAISAHVGFELS